MFDKKWFSCFKVITFFPISFTAGQKRRFLSICVDFPELNKINKSLNNTDFVNIRNLNDTFLNDLKIQTYEVDSFTPNSFEVSLALTIPIYKTVR